MSKKITEKEGMEFVKGFLIVIGLGLIVLAIFRMVVIFFAKFIGFELGLILTVVCCFGIGYGVSWLKKKYGPQ